ncbi:MAG: ABC transporter permease [Acidobacteria bacterium]|nr:ABC transporter permease [Acidobacteriota bacterium]
MTLRVALQAVIRKELRDARRDRRSLVAALAYALWGPAVMAFALFAIARASDPDAALRLGILQPGRAPGGPVGPLKDPSRIPTLVSELSGLPNVTVETLAGEDVETAATAVRRRDVDVALVLERDAEVRFEGLRPVALTLVYDAARSSGARRASRVRAAIASYERGISDARLVLRGVAPSSVDVFRVEERDVSTAASRAATANATLPLFLLLAAFIGGMNVAIDATAGERERASLEHLLVHPVPGWVLAAGKWVVATLLAIVSVALTLAVSAFLLSRPRLLALDLGVGLPAREAMDLFAVLAPLACFATAIQMLVAAQARSFKEAQTTLSMLLFLPMMAGFVQSFSSLVPTFRQHLVPVWGHQLLVGGLLRGERAGVEAFLGLSLFTLLAAAACVAATGRLLRNERMIASS